MGTRSVELGVPWGGYQTNPLEHSSVYIQAPYRLPSQVSRDVKLVFGRARQRIAKMLQVIMKLVYYQT